MHDFGVDHTRFAQKLLLVNAFTGAQGVQYTANRLDLLKRQVFAHHIQPFERNRFLIEPDGLRDGIGFAQAAEAFHGADIGEQRFLLRGRGRAVPKGRRCPA